MNQLTDNNNENIENGFSYDYSERLYQWISCRFFWLSICDKDVKNTKNFKLTFV